jgi:hypothetical protein
MTGKLTIKLTEEQQKQIKEATGKDRPETDHRGRSDRPHFHDP